MDEMRAALNAISAAAPRAAAAGAVAGAAAPAVMDASAIMGSASHGAAQGAVDGTMAGSVAPAVLDAASSGAVRGALDGSRRMPAKSAPVRAPERAPGPQPGTVEWIQAVRAAQPTMQERAYADAMNSAEQRVFQAQHAPAPKGPSPKADPVAAAKPTDQERAYAKAMDDAERMQWMQTRTPMVGMGSVVPQIAQGDPTMAAAALHGAYRPDAFRPTPEQHAQFQAMLQQQAGITPGGALVLSPGPVTPPTAPPRPPPTAVAMKGRSK